MKRLRTVTLLTDFGERDYYVGAVKGVLLRLAPECRLVDLCHQIAPGDLEHAAFVLGAAAREYPEGTVHLAVVDPGVGSDRRILAARADGQLAVAPDNGLLTEFLARCQNPEVRSVLCSDLFLDRPGATFDGRDRLAPTAAYLARGEPYDDLGPLIIDALSLPTTAPERRRHGLSGRVVHIDHFGNIVTNLPSDWLDGRPFTVRVGGARIDRLVRHYSELADGEAAVIPGSLGTLELSLNRGNLAAVTQVSRGKNVEIEFR
ncbi:MAG: SAM-dependent chlorinase/fluorinase [Acidobacteriota bacterium]|nr:SAM-dependent chlorinase/fluorinase [Acidobacteriota bacterium]